MKMISMLFLGGALGAVSAMVGCGDSSSSTTSSGASTTATTTTTTSGGGGSTGSTTSSSTGSGMLSCDAYCTEIMANCKDAATQQYTDLATCMAVCPAFPTGTVADTKGDTLGCRSYHGGTPAMGDPTTHCPHAGPGGANTCGANCEGFCAIATKACTGAMAQYTDAADCMTKCGTFDDTVPFNSGVTTGNSLACRIYHASAAAKDPTTHCPHIGVTSPVCK
jgi:hypothetical protein